MDAKNLTFSDLSIETWNYKRAEDDVFQKKCSLISKDNRGINFFAKPTAYYWLALLYLPITEYLLCWLMFQQPQYHE